MRSDDRGVLGMPVRLAVAVLVIATMVPVVLGMVGTAEDSIGSSELEREADRLRDGAARAYYGGEGTIVSVDLRLPPGASLGVGGDGGGRYVIRLIEDGEEVGRVYIDRPAVPVLGPAAEVSGSVTVKLEAVTVDGVYGVRLVRCWSSRCPAWSCASAGWRCWRWSPVSSGP